MNDLKSSVQALLKVAKVFPTDKALERYLHDHPDADKSKHHVKNEGKPVNKGLEEYADKKKQQEGRKSPFVNEGLEALRGKKGSDTELVGSLRSFQAAVDKTAALDADTLLEVQGALAEKNGSRIRKALGELKGEKAAVYLLNAMKRKAINVNEALKIIGG